MATPARVNSSLTMTYKPSFDHSYINADRYRTKNTNIYISSVQAPRRELGGLLYRGYNAGARQSPS